VGSESHVHVARTLDAVAEVAEKSEAVMRLEDAASEVQRRY
jgi:hypothetical protein